MLGHKPGRNNGQKFSGIRALTAVKIWSTDEKNEVPFENMVFNGKQFEDSDEKK